MREGSSSDLAQGAEGVFIDEALNVIYPIAVTKDNPVVVFMAHTDVVFPDMEALPLTTENGRIIVLAWEMIQQIW